MDANGDLVVIELKVSRGYDRVVGQLIRYVAWIKKNLAEANQQVRGVIVAREIRIFTRTQTGSIKLRKN